MRTMSTPTFVSNPPPIFQMHLSSMSQEQQTILVILLLLKNKTVTFYAVGEGNFTIHAYCLPFLHSSRSSKVFQLQRLVMSTGMTFHEFFKFSSCLVRCIGQSNGFRLEYSYYKGIHLFLIFISNRNSVLIEDPCIQY